MNSPLSETAKSVLLSLAQATRPHPAVDYRRAPAYEVAVSGLANIVDGFIAITARGLEMAAALGGKA